MSSMCVCYLLQQPEKQIHFKILTDFSALSLCSVTLLHCFCHFQGLLERRKALITLKVKTLDLRLTLYLRE